MPGSISDRLLTDGYAVVRNALPPSVAAAVSSEVEGVFEGAVFADGPFFGFRTKRFGRLLTRAPSSAALVLHPAILAAAEAILLPYSDTIQLNMTQAIQIWPGEREQVPHRDEDTWDRPPKGEVEYLVNVMWPLTTFSPANGGTRVWPESHRRSAGPANSSCAAALDPGDALIFLGSTLHCGGANQSRHPRTGVIVSYALGWLRPYENQTLSYPPDVARSFPPRLCDLIGYTRNRPNLGNVDLRCPSELLRAPPSDGLPASEALRPDQTAAILAYYDMLQRAA